MKLCYCMAMCWRKEELKMDHYRVVACEYVEWAVLDMHLN